MFKKIVLILSVSFYLSACSEHDLSYYQGNLEDAESKVKECELDIKEAYLNEDLKRVQSIAEDLECKAASRAHNDYKKELAALEQKKRAEARQ
ncbi:hypothetical protein TUM4438_46590 [Shewanella sairae]|uniref:DUF1090 domain-containing protein n=1 Tax=Shewanella sairae TaxID=190310 RepID=A0ABQ4PS48_9GAMM|nr:hypothetical protein [Shewanella sairae]MCL1132766.1 hypothetical protein [Shewanella sairae]GIU52967.1 hypothetical protein TUM4438_46590 [Shewanella sairae]